jgi:5-formyltetrahydrofolate cyclo-ligase
MNELILKKQKLRTELLDTRRDLSKEFVFSKSLQVIEKLITLQEYKLAKSVMFYVSLEKEVLTIDLLKKELEKNDKKIIVPIINDKIIVASRLKCFSDLKQNKFKIFEPENFEKFDSKIDIILIPGVGFDKKGSRIGFGKGYYDKFLFNKNDSLKIGLCFEECIVDAIPLEEHDVLVDIVITEKNVYYVNDLKNIE